MDEKSFGCVLDIADAQARQLRSPHPAGKADEQDHPVPELDKALSELCHRSSDLSSGDRSLLVAWGNPKGPTKPAHRLSHERVTTGIAKSGEAVCLADRRETAGERRDSRRLSIIGRKAKLGEVPSNTSRRCGESPSISHQVEKSEKSER